MTEEPAGRSSRHRFFDLSFWQATVSNIVSLVVFAGLVAIGGAATGHVRWGDVGTWAALAVIVGGVTMIWTIVFDRPHGLHSDDRLERRSALRGLMGTVLILLSMVVGLIFSHGRPFG